MEQTNPNGPLFPYVWVDPERLGGEPCFRNTRVPVSTLFDYLEGGEPLAEFFADFPSVTQEQAEGVLRLAREWLSVTSKATAA